MMAWFPVLFVTLLILSLSAKPSLSISLRFPDHNSPTEAGDLLLGDAHFVGDGESVQLSRTKPLSFGIIIHNTPLKFSPSTSLSSTFTFEIGNRVALVIIAADFPSKFAKNTSFEQLDENRFVNIEFGANLCTISSSRVRNVSNINHGLKNGMKLTSWIDYRAILQRLDVRLSKLGHPKPIEPLISYRINLGEILKGKEVLLGLASSNEEHEQITSVYSWSSEIKDVPKWMHSLPAIPLEHPTVQTSKSKGCYLSGFIFATGCGAFAGLILFFVWSYVGYKQKMQGECPVDFRYEKIGVLKVKDAETGMK